MQRAAMNTLLLFAIGIVTSACGGTFIETPTMISTPTLTATYTSLPKTTSTPTETLIPLSPISNVISLSENDAQYMQLKDAGYFLSASGSLIGPEGFTYSAYLFINPDISPFYAGSDPTKDTLVITFYRWDGKTNEFISVQNLPTVDNVYAGAANIVNWDQPFSGTGLLDVVIEPNEETKPLLKQVNYSSDINQNGLLEFAFAVEYCPISCSHPTAGVQLFEVQNTSLVDNITQDLPGRTYFGMHSKDPFTFYVVDHNFYDIYLDISTFWIYTWDGSRFVDVSSQYAAEYLAEANSKVSELKSAYGEPFDEGGIQSEMKSLEILKLYEKAGMAAEGLEVFLDITDISHWENTSLLSQCWLQISRAMAQEDFKQNQSFDLPPGSSYWRNNLDMVESYEEPLKQAGYDTSACNSITP